MVRDGYDGASPILVTGAAGTVGRGVVAGLAAGGVPVRAAVTNAPGRTSDASADARRGGQVEAVRFDFTDSSTWQAAFDGVEQMFLLRPPHLGRPRTQMLPSLEAARAAGVRQVVLLSLQGAERNRVVPHATLEAWLRGSGLDWTFVRPSFFMQNRHRAWTPTGPEALTYAQVASILSRVLGRRIAYSSPSAVRYAAHARRTLGLPAGMVAVTTAIYTVARLGRAGGLTDDVRTVTGRDARSLEDFARRHAAEWQRVGA